MKRRVFAVAWALVVALLVLNACGVPYSLVSERHISSEENFTVDLPEGWRQHNISADPLRGFTALLEKRRKLSWDVIRLTRDGLLLQQICIGRIPLSAEMANTKRKLAEQMLPSELAEVISDEFRSNSNLTHQEILENLPAAVGGHSGFKLHYTYRSDELKLEGLFYGALVGPWLYYILYEAPAQHYFAKDLAIFDKTRSSFQVTKAAS
jgi:hypothetical protein